jgi:hypothetical protein
MLNIPVSISAVARGFGCKRDRFTSTFAHGLEPPEARGRHLEMDEDREREILAWISQHAAKSTPITRRNLCEHLTTKYDLPTKRGWVNSFIDRHIVEIYQMKSPPQEAERLEVRRYCLDQMLICIYEFVHGRPLELVFNLDGVEIPAWEDRNSNSHLSHFCNSQKVNPGTALLPNEAHC